MVGLFPSVAGISGDYNRDGVVDAADYTVWRDNVGSTCVPCSGADANCNGFVENGEYQVWKDNFGRNISGSAGSGSTAISAVAEPTALQLLILALVAFGIFRIGHVGILPVHREKLAT
jgi:hypothetical protein